MIHKDKLYPFPSYKWWKKYIKKHGYIFGEPRIQHLRRMAENWDILGQDIGLDTKSLGSIFHNPFKEILKKECDKDVAPLVVRCSCL